MQKERGSTLIGQLLALALIGIALVTFVTGLSTSSLGVRVVEQRVSAENLARTQMELVKAAPYSPNPTAVPYPSVSASAVQGYSILTTVTYWNGSTFVSSPPGAGDERNLQRIRVEVSTTLQGQRAFVLEDYKGNRP
jgi:type II secretory pathway pseudopilin PulG